MKKNIKKKFIILGFLFVFLIVCVAGATYAYFNLTATDDETITGTVGGANLVLTVTKELPTTNPSDMIPQLEDTLEDAINSPYLCIDDHNNVVCQVYKATLQNTGSISAQAVGTISFDNISTLPNLKWKLIDSLTVIGDGETQDATTEEQVFETDVMINPGNTINYYFIFWIDEIGGEQEDEGTFRATINFDATSSGVTSQSVNAASLIQNLYNTEGDTITTVNIAGDSTKPQVSLNSTRGIMLDNNGEYRYYGEDPSNYVYFNCDDYSNQTESTCEKWRIISVSNVKSSENDTVGSHRMKIISSQRIGGSWDSSESTINNGYGVNDWTQADSNTVLNTLYYNRESGVWYNDANNASSSKPIDFKDNGFSDASKNFINNALWYLGGISELTNFYANDCYDFERGTTVWGSTNTQTCNDGACPRATNWTGKIGLIYPSDYLYATDLSVCLEDGMSYEEDTNCNEYDWLYNSLSEWTITPIYNRANRVALRMESIGINNYASDAFAKRPVVYLKSNVEIIGGQGTSGQPYQLSLSSE